MKPFLKVGGFLGLFVMVAVLAGYFTVKTIVQSNDAVVVPDLEGKDVVYALELLTDLGLNTKVSGYEYTNDIPKNHVAYQDPKPGAEVKTKRDIRVVISKGPQTVVAPNLVGVDLRDANIIIEENGLVRGVMSETFAKNLSKGEVVSQAPLPGQLVDKGHAVDLLVSLGPRPQRFMMPHLGSLSPEDAILLLERSRLGLGQIRYTHRTDVALDVVVEQEPRPGYPIATGTLAYITVNRLQEVPIKEKGFFFLHRPALHGLLKTHVRLRVNAFGIFYDIFDDFRPPGEDLWILLPRQSEGTFFLYEDDALVLTHSFGLKYGYPALGTIDMDRL